MTVALLLSYIQTALAFVFIFAVLVMFHELGHFITARLTGMRVDEFAFGFGPRLVKLFKRGDTEYSIRAFPLGGFVKIAGMEPGEEAISDGFQAQAIWKRAIVIFSGPFASFLLAVAVFLGLGLFWGYPFGKTTNEVAMVGPKTEAARVGLSAGDHITEINGTKITQGKQMTDIIHSMPGKPIHIKGQRNSSSFTATAVPRWRIDFLDGTWSFMKGNTGVLEGMTESSPAIKAGLQPKDELVSINKKNITGGASLVDAINAADGKPMSIVVNRNGKQVTATVKPCVQKIQIAGIKLTFPGMSADSPNPNSPIINEDRLLSIDGKEIRSGEQLLTAIRQSKKTTHSVVVYRDASEKLVKWNISGSDVANIQTSYYNAYGVLGFTPADALVKAGVAESLSRGMRITWSIVGQLIETLTTKRIKDDIGGPLMIGRATHSAVARGPYDVLSLLGGLSLSLAFINLLPIPIVDGGHLVILAVEAVRRKRLTTEQMQVIQMIGLVILVGIFILVMWSDLFKLSHGLVPQ